MDRDNVKKDSYKRETKGSYVLYESGRHKIEFPQKYVDQYFILPLFCLFLLLVIRQPVQRLFSGEQVKIRPGRGIVFRGHRVMLNNRWAAVSHKLRRIPYDTYSSYWEKGRYYHRLEYAGPGFILIFRSGKAVLKPEARLFRIMVNDVDSGLKGIVPGTSTWVAVLQVYGYPPDAEDSITWIYPTKGLEFGVDSFGLVNSIILFRPDEDYVEQNSVMKDWLLKYPLVF